MIKKFLFSNCVEITKSIIDNGIIFNNYQKYIFFQTNITLLVKKLTQKLQLKQQKKFKFFQ
ncbi:unnamed protein product [Paramecium pentaurelia]|uniref:Uncharacterized protein n=1 Tax=Paramecium pentaurelia TaxID=43138 RepID=A0A8S1V030_9CILI|nr:unnamed protein product [Paramecium pentaurelia]